MDKGEKEKETEKKGTREKEGEMEGNGKRREKKEKKGGKINEISTNFVDFSIENFSNI